MKIIWIFNKKMEMIVHLLHRIIILKLTNKFKGTKEILITRLVILNCIKHLFKTISLSKSDLYLKLNLEFWKNLMYIFLDISLRIIILNKQISQAKQITKLNKQMPKFHKKQKSIKIQKLNIFELLIKFKRKLYQSK